MKKLIGLALAYFLLQAIAFPGDAAYFVDEGFSKDGSVYVFGQYGKTDKTYNSYAEIYTVDVAKLLLLMDKYDPTRRRILVVDDEPIILRSIKIWLDNDFDLFLVNSGEMALEFLESHFVDLVLLDYKMPTMDGPSVLEAIRSNEKLKDTPVIFLTANNDRQSVITAMQYKPDGYILKSETPDEIKTAVVDFFKNRALKLDF